MNHVTSENMYFLRHRDFEDFVNFGRFGSFYHQISSIYPEFILHPWKFGKCEDRFWSVEKNQSLYLSWLGRILGYRTFNDWYAITTGLISQNFGCSLLRLHNNSCYLTLKKTMPYFGWCPWKFSCTFKNFWLDSQNLRIFYENLAEEMNIQVMEDWYSFNMQIFVVVWGTSTRTTSHNTTRILGSIGYSVTTRAYQQHWQHFFQQKIHFGVGGMWFGVEHFGGRGMRYSRVGIFNFSVFHLGGI
eukprot:TRINITY_DN5740_c0_g1_i5.p1 TRINITY_DN5740_c0_g1~~TRINITY_DN5740_c0_g1_i5.p1  ORF type:complete len:244 (-),score=16.68 TRINITY_DN5740_c0_g1_i5:103-834(-)